MLNIIIIGKTGEKFTLSKGWTARPKFRAPSFTVVKGACFVSGVAHLANPSAPLDRIIGQLPRECRPEASMVFTLNHKEFAIKVNVRI